MFRQLEKAGDGDGRGWLDAQLTAYSHQRGQTRAADRPFEVYGTDPKGNRVEAYFHPVSFKKLLVSRCGEILYRAK